MKKLFLLRHAKASRDLLFIKDIERPLTERGFHDAKMVSEWLKKKYPAPGILISSPAIRAYSTALVFASAFQKKAATIQLEERLYDSSIKDYLEVIEEIDDSAISALLAGHNEVLSDTAKKLLKDGSFESLRTCGVVVITSPARTWKEFSHETCTCERILDPSRLPGE